VTSIPELSQTFSHRSSHRTTQQHGQSLTQVIAQTDATPTADTAVSTSRSGVAKIRMGINPTLDKLKDAYHSLPGLLVCSFFSGSITVCVIHLLIVSLFASFFRAFSRKKKLNRFPPV
jgi:hypothetical protein